jgi:hypothetical protein
MNNVEDVNNEHNAVRPYLRAWLIPVLEDARLLKSVIIGSTSRIDVKD